MKREFYLPALFSKKGEFDGLSKLSPGTKRAIVPLLTVTPLEFDHTQGAKPKSIEDHLESFCKKYSKAWLTSNAFIDTFMVDDKRPAGVTSMEFIYKLLDMNGLNPSPIIRMDSSASYLDALDTLDLLYNMNEPGFRITMTDITSPDFEENLNSLLEKTKKKPEGSHLILDLEAADFSNYEDFSDGILDVLEFFPDLQKWKSFTVCGGSFPPTQKFDRGEHKIPRNEWKFYQSLMKKIKGKSFERKINFGDYSVVSPGYFEYNPVKMSRSANIRYTHSDFWYVQKGSALKKSSDFQQYVSQAKNIVKSPYYSGEDFSSGDQHIRKCSKGLTTPGSPTVWKWVGNNHHFTKVIDELTASYPFSSDSE